MPIDIAIVNGKITTFEFHDQCTGESFDVAPEIRECITKSLSTWRYAVWPVCPGEQSLGVDFVYLAPERDAIRTPVGIAAGSCGG